MPELPDVTVYIEALDRHIKGRRLNAIRVFSPFLLRTVDPPIGAVEGHTVTDLRRIGKRIALGFEGGTWLVLHLMIAGRLRWREPGAKPPGKIGLAAFDFDHGTLLLTEAGSKRRASLHVIADEAGLAELDPGGLEPFEIDAATFAGQLRSGNHTLKRALTDPKSFSGIGNAYSDEILHRARLSPIAMTGKLTDEEAARLYQAVQETLRDWVQILREDVGEGFPEKVTAFRDEMAVHGRFGKPCPVCGTPVQRIRYASNETNYCPKCQTDERILADRSLSRLLKKDWPRSIDEL